MRKNRKDYGIVTRCPFCGCSNVVSVNETDYYYWDGSGELVQNAFPYLSADERELLISGICPTCWDNLFSEDE